MLFNSYTFLIFFAVVLCAHRLPLPWRLKKGNLLLASYLFYAAWNPPFVILLWISTLVDWNVVRALKRTAPEHRRRRRLLLGLSLTANLGLLAFFKYGQFAVQNFRGLLFLLGVDFQPLPIDIILPVGISFYTFQTLSYTLDAYYGRAKPWHSFLDYALYVTFFPQLVAGPILRATEFLPQCVEERRATSHQLGFGFTLLLIGLFEKVVVADGFLAPIVDAVYSSDVTQPSPTAAWHGTLAFAGQIFCDFAGYSACAIGVAMCLGFSFPHNFRGPYAAVGFSDFWQRWHISLSSWLRDYLYIPLGGNRSGPRRTSINLMLTMLIGGMWHGAAWTFVAWGALHGGYLITERWLRSNLPSRPLWSHPVSQLALGLGTFVAVCFAWVFFRAESFGQAGAMTAAMFGMPLAEIDFGLDGDSILICRTTILAILLTHWGLRNTSLEAATLRCPWWLRAILLAAMMIAIAHTPTEDRAFLYFQF